MEQRDLFGQTAAPGPYGTPSPPHNGTPTSADAAALIAPSVNDLQRRVLDYLRGRGVLGATNEEIEDALGLTGNTVRPRVWELRKAGLVLDTARTRPTRAGRKAVVHVAAPVTAAPDKVTPPWEDAFDGLTPDERG